MGAVGFESLSFYRMSLSSWLVEAFLMIIGYSLTGTGAARTFKVGIVESSPATDLIQYVSHIQDIDPVVSVNLELRGPMSKESRALKACKTSSRNGGVRYCVIL